MGESAWFVKTKSEIIFVQIFRWVREDKDSTGATSSSQDHRRKYVAVTSKPHHIIWHIVYIIVLSLDRGPQLQTHHDAIFYLSDTSSYLDPSVDIDPDDIH